MYNSSALQRRDRAGFTPASLSSLTTPDLQYVFFNIAQHKNIVNKWVLYDSVKLLWICCEKNSLVNVFTSDSGICYSYVIIEI